MDEDEEQSTEGPYEEVFECQACGGIFPLPAIRVWDTAVPDYEVALCMQCFLEIEGLS